MPRNDHIYKEVGEELGYPAELVKLVYTSTWNFVKKTLKEIQITEDTTEEEFNQMRTSFYFPRFGKLFLSYEKIESLRRREKWKREHIYNKNEDKEDKADVHYDSDHDG